MDSYPALATLAIILGIGWASGINLYGAVAVLGIAGATGYVTLPADLQVLQEPWVIGVAGLLYIVQFIADKVPGLDSGWDLLHTFIRIPVGAFLASGAVAEVGPVSEALAALLGGSMAALSHLSKASSRLLINTSPEPFSNWTASLVEDLLVFAGLWIMLVHPAIFLALLLVFIALVIWLMPKLWRQLRRAGRRLGAWLGMTAESADAKGEGDVGPASTPPRLPGLPRDGESR